MFIIDDTGNVTLTRGDSFRVPLFINKGTELKPSRKELGDNDFVYLGIMEPNQPFEKALIRKKYDKNNEKTDDGDIIVKLGHSDTVQLLPGKYFYQVKFVNEVEDIVDTIIDKKEFIIAE